MQNVAGIESVDDDGAAGRPVDAPRRNRPLEDLKTGNQARVDIAPIARAIIAAPDREGLFGAVDDDGYAPRPLDTANAGIECAAIARVSAEYIDHALEHVGRVHALVALDLFLGGISG